MNPGWSSYRKFHDTVVFACVLIAILYVPVPLGSNRPVAWFALEIFAYGSLAFAVLGFVARPQTLSLTKPTAGILTLLCLWLGLVFLQTVPLPRGVVEHLNPLVYKFQENLALISIGAKSTLSIDPDTTGNEALKYGAYVTLFFLTLATVNTKGRLLSLVSVIVAAGVLESVLGLYAYASGYSLFAESGVGSRGPSGTFVNPNHFANLLIMVLGMVLGLVASIVNSQEPENRLRVARYAPPDLAALTVLSAAALIIMVAVLASGARSPVMFLALSFAVVLLMAKAADRADLGEYVLVPFVLFALGTVTILLALEGGSLTSVIGQIFSQEWLRQNVSGLKLLTSVWATGVGAGNYRWVFPMFRDDGLRFATYDQANNDYLQAAIEQGIPAALILGLAVWLMVRQLYRGYRSRRNTLMRGVIFGCLVSVLFMLAHATIEFSFRIPANAVYFLVISGAGIAAGRLERRSRRSKDVLQNGEKS